MSCVPARAEKVYSHNCCEEGAEYFAEPSLSLPVPQGPLAQHLAGRREATPDNKRPLASIRRRAGASRSESKGPRAATSLCQSVD